MGLRYPEAFLNAWAAGKYTKDLAICVHGTTKVQAYRLCWQYVSRSGGHPALLLWLYHVSIGNLACSMSPGALAIYSCVSRAVLCSIFGQVTPDQYLNTIPFMDAIKETLDAMLAKDGLLPKL